MRLIKICTLVCVLFAFSNIENTYSDFYKEVKFWKYNQAIIVYDKQVKTLKELWYSTGSIVDLLTLKAMECNSYKWDCVWMYWPDIWHYQINSIHKEQYKKSYELFNKKKWWELFIYQSNFANSLIESYKKNNCSQKSFKKIKKKFTKSEEFQCIARSYNWSKKKVSYWKLALIKKWYITTYINNLK